MSSPIVSISVHLRSRRTSGGSAHGTDHVVNVKTWKEAHDLVVDERTTAAWLRPRWENGICLHNVMVGYLSVRGAQNLTAREVVGDLALGEHMRRYLKANFVDGRNAKKVSSRSSLAREALTRCAWSDAKEDALADGLVLDAVRRSLEACFPDHHQTYFDRVRAWAVDGGGIK